MSLCNYNISVGRGVFRMCDRSLLLLVVSKVTNYEKVIK